jgi:alpha-mannosidase
MHYLLGYHLFWRVEITNEIGMKLKLCSVLSLVVLSLPFATRPLRAEVGASAGPSTQPTAEAAVASAPRPTLYVVGYAHLDTQWRWSYPQVIAQFLHNTMQDNFKLFEKYPHYVFNFTGANRYLMMKEYFPEDFATLKKYVAAGRWFPAGSSMEEGDVNMPNGEAIIRQVLYGNQFFHREFGVQSDEFMLPDCFGFQASLPSLLAHCGIKAFSTQKLTWGSAVGIPFNLGVWTGPDGTGVVAALNPGSYSSGVTDDLSQDPYWLTRVEADGKRSGVYVDYHYFGTGDRGGSPDEKSVQWVEKSVTGSGPVRVICGPADQMVKDLSPADVTRLPRYTGDLLLTNHSCGSLSSQAFVKRTNRKLEEIGDAAERAAVTADWLGSASYPREKLLHAWTLQLGAHFHDTMAGTGLPKTYEYSWNNMILALNQFAAVLEDSVGAVAQAMDTRGDGTAVVVYNPLSVDRQDAAEVTIPAINTAAGDAIAVTDAEGKAVPFQIEPGDSAEEKIVFLAHAAPVSFSVYHIASVGGPAAGWTELKVDQRTVENAHFRVTLNDAGDIASIFDKQNNREVLASPSRLEFLHQNPRQYPAWNMDYQDRSRAPIGYVDGPCSFSIAENGPARVAIETRRQARGSTVTQLIRLSAGDAGDRIEVVNHVDWQTREVSLEATFPMSFGNPVATYESQSAAVQRGNNNEKKFEVPQQQWLDLTSNDGSYGAAILNDGKYGSDKPDDSTIRLTLLFTPGVQAGYQDQATQDIGRHEFTYAIVPHAGSWQQGKVAWAGQRLNQPLETFTTAAHKGSLGKSFSVAAVDQANVSISAMKKAEDSDELIVRLRETDGQLAEQTTLSFATAIQSAREVDGQERELGRAKVVDGKLVTRMRPFALRAFAIKLAPPVVVMSAPVTQAIPLAYDLDVVSRHENLSDGSFDSKGHSFAAEAFPAQIQSEGINFNLGLTEDGKNNALACKGQTIDLPAGTEKVYLLAAAVNGDAPAVFKVGGREIHTTVQDWSGYIGQWDNRVWRGVVPELTYNFANKFAGLTPGFIKRDTVAWFCSHRHDPVKGTEFYKFTYLFKYALDVPADATTLTLPDNSNIRIFAITTAKSVHDQVTAGQALYDTLAEHQYAAPVISPLGGTFSDSVACTIEHSLFGHSGDLHFTVDGSEPTENSPVYTGPISLSSSVTVRARQFEMGQAIGNEVSQKYVIDDVTLPKVMSASVLKDLPELRVVFSKPVTRASAENTDSYQLNSQAKLQSAKLLDDGVTVRLALAEPLRAGADLSIRVTGVQDNSARGNVLAAVTVPVGSEGPIFHVDEFAGDGTKSKEFAAGGDFGKSDAAWTMSFLLRVPEVPKGSTIIAGFGMDLENDDSTGRYVNILSGGVHLRLNDQDVAGNPVEVNQWERVTATYDGKTVRLYKNADQVAERGLELPDDSTMVRLAPHDPQQHKRRFKGEIKDLSIWPVELQPAEVAELAKHLPN